MIIAVFVLKNFLNFWICDVICFFVKIIFIILYIEVLYIIYLLCVLNTKLTNVQQEFFQAFYLCLSKIRIKIKFYTSKINRLTAPYV